MSKIEITTNIFYLQLTTITAILYCKKTGRIMCIHAITVILYRSITVSCHFTCCDRVLNLWC